MNLRASVKSLFKPTDKSSYMFHIFLVLPHVVLQFVYLDQPIKQLTTTTPPPLTALFIKSVVRWKYLQKQTVYTWLTVHGLPYMAYRTWLTIHGLPYMGYRTWVTVHGLPYMAYRTWLTAHAYHKWLTVHATSTTIVDLLSSLI